MIVKAPKLMGWDEFTMLRKVDEEERSPWTRSWGSAVYTSHGNQGMRGRENEEGRPLMKEES